MQLPSPLGPDPSLPSPVGPLSGLAGISTPGAMIAAKVAGDLTNNVSAVPVDLGISIPVLANNPIYIHCDWMITMAGAGGCVVRISHPAATTRIARSRCNSTGISVVVENFVLTTASPQSFVGATQFAYIGSGLMEADIYLVTSADGFVTFDFAPATNGQLMTIREGSHAYFF